MSLHEMVRPIIYIAMLVNVTEQQRDTSLSKVRSQYVLADKIEQAQLIRMGGTTMWSCLGVQCFPLGKLVSSELRMVIIIHWHSGYVNSTVHNSLTLCSTQE